MGGNSSRPWTELSGETNWKDMLDPLDEDLRMYLIHYGERVQAIGDVYNGQTESEGYGLPLFPMDKLFSEVGLETANNPFRYEVTQYFYVLSKVLNYPPEDPDQSWIGYVAVSTDEGTKNLGRRDILVAWRGTADLLESWADIQDDLVPATDIFQDDTDTKIHSGFYALYTKNYILNPYTKLSTRDQVLREVRKQVDYYASKNETISITVVGHSLGAALATINALDIVTNGYNVPTGHPEKACLVTAFPFASPKVGDENFRKKFLSFEKLRALRVTNAIDIVPFLPPIRYYHVGEQLMVDSRKSPYLRPLKSGLTGAVATGHMLETYLHLVAGTQGIDSEKFNLGSRRGIALVNKGWDALNDDCKIPAQWWVAKNKNMVQNGNDGSWSLADAYIPPPPEDDQNE
ncbi:phospholipase A1-IIgamma-like [Syzygium oleosum]|uniref:phospholipase A1-IIgamma-like n=1 Tax=Syzygium oleosum TaxID=219896 RepID=UPI0024B978F5|nr:phospholipase A1-IIgamma-like [Syzygium oleosum]